MRHARLFPAFVLIASCFACGPVRENATSGPAGDSAEVVDLSLLVSPDYPCVWPSNMMPYARVDHVSIGPGAYNRDLVVIDEHTGTQWDAPAHFIPPPGSGLPNEGPNGVLTNEKVPISQFVGEACVVDLRNHVDDAKPGHSFLITPERVKAWEKAHRPLRAGDVVLFYSGYSDRYYRPFPAGDRFVATALNAETPGWPAPTPDCMKYLADRGVRLVGTDGPSMGPLPELAAATHITGGQKGVIFTEGAINLGKLPATGSFYAMLAPKHAGGSGGEARSLAITDKAVARRLLESVREKRILDLSVLLESNHPVSWPGARAGAEAPRYLPNTINYFNEARGPFFAKGHVLDGHVGTHLVPPSFALPRAGFDDARYAPDIRAVLRKYEARFGRRGTSDVTTEKVPLGRLAGPARVVDVRRLIGTTSRQSWPASPIITMDHLKRHEKEHGPIAAGEVVVFRSGYSDAHFKPLPAGNRMMAEPLQGKAEGWPAPAPEVVAYLADKGVRCVATDGPTLGGADPEHALTVYWAAGGRGLPIVEYLTNLGPLPATGGYFIFAPIKTAGGHGGYGRAVGLY